MDIASKNIIDCIRNSIKHKSAKLHDPIFLGNEKKYLKDCIDMNIVSTTGPFISKLENKLKDFTSVKYVSLLNSGTSALQIALIVAGVEEQNEVLMPAMTFAATAHAVMYLNATPHFVDSEMNTLGIDVSRLRDYLQSISIKKNGYTINKQTNKIIKAIIPVHTFGHPVNISQLLKLGREFNLKIIEDSAESIGSFYKKKHTGTFGSLGVLSFNGNKTITTGGGGAILTNNKEYDKLARHLAATSKKSHHWEYIHDRLGFNYRMPNLNAALGLAQMENIKKILKNKRKLYSSYKYNFSNNEYVDLFKEPKNCKSNYWFQTIILKNKHVSKKNIIIKNLNNHGLQCRPAWKILPELNHLRRFPKMNLINAKKIYSAVINIPSNITLNEKR